MHNTTTNYQLNTLGTNNYIMHISRCTGFFFLHVTVLKFVFQIMVVLPP